ncbi:hypothetical protein PR003_g20022 [Phytophthora rubi]|uniref:Uncharacterized protein n=2 Tax=Phytophthora rubi TaxID=129364 RepID=A0A6A4DU95_9STRA|nr:hypothetical protein PR003_g20022 [Phytophthora rubi]
MAQYLREPLFVIDVDAHNDAHVQRYYYQDYVLPNGDLHETGGGGAMTDATAKEMFRTYARLHVLPVIIVLKRHEGHFYGVHHGDVSTRWQAEGDLTFTHAHYASHSWFQEVLTLGEYSVAQLGRADVMEDEDQTNMIIIGGMERRDRLDVVHDRLGLPRLDSAPYDIAILEDGLHAETDRLQALVGQMGTGPANPPPSPGTTARRGTPVRAPISNHGRVEFTVLSRILNSIEMEPELLSDRSKLRQLLKENTSAVTTWRRTADPQLKPPIPHGGRADLMAMLPWLLEHRAALHALFSYLPYPELAAKMVPMSQMLFWGALEAYDNQVLMLRRAVVDDAMPANAKEYCRTWLAACTTEQGSTQARVIARDPARWKRLRAMAPTAPSCACPGGVGEDDWYILHVLPHVAWTWPASTWGQFSIHCIGSLLHDHPALSQLCQSITTQAEWGGTIDIPSGLTWADRLVSMEAGLPAPSRR